MTDLLVRATNLNKVYRSNAAPVRAVANVSISIAAGEYRRHLRPVGLREIDPPASSRAARCARFRAL